MTIIKIEQTTPEFKKGFKSAMKMILKWCEQGTYSSIEELEISLRSGLMLDDLMNERDKNK